MEEYLQTLYIALGNGNLYLVVIVAFTTMAFGIYSQTKSFMESSFVIWAKGKPPLRYMDAPVKKWIIITLINAYIFGSIVVLWHLVPYATQVRLETEKITVGVECRTAKMPKICPEKGFVRLMAFTTGSSIAFLNENNSVIPCISGENVDIGPYRDHITTFQYCTIKNWSATPLSRIEWPIRLHFLKEEGKKFKKNSVIENKIIFSGLKPNAENGIDFYIGNHSTHWLEFEWLLEVSVWPIGSHGEKKAKVIMPALGNIQHLFPAKGLKEGEKEK